MIFQSFQTWNKSPILTNIETLPITDLQFPKITVCPPKDTFTNLNYDIEMLGNKTIDDDTKNKLFQYLFDEVHEQQFEQMMKNLLLFHNNEYEIFYNWYQGATKIIMPFHDPRQEYDLYYVFETSKLRGSFQTPYYLPYKTMKSNKRNLIRED